jgi:serine/threonine protein kinase
MNGRTQDEINYEDYTPSIEGVTILKMLYKTKQSYLWLCKLEDDTSIYILKGKKRSNLSLDEIEFLKRERQFLEGNKDKRFKNFPFFIKAAKDDYFVYMILNFFEGCTLSSLLQDNVFKFNSLSSEKDFYEKKNIYLSLISQIIYLIGQLHENGYIHRDIKLNNLIVNKNLRISLIDFGFTKLINNDRTSTICGTYHSMAPEMLGLRYNQGKDYDKSIDIYSLGVLFFELFVGKPIFPYLYEYNEDVIKNYYSLISAGVNEANFGNNFMEENSRNFNEITILFHGRLKDLITKCMSRAEERINFSSLKEHPIFENNFEFLRKNDMFLSECTNHYNRSILESIEFNGDFLEDYLLINAQQDLLDKYF